MDMLRDNVAALGQTIMRPMMNQIDSLFIVIYQE